MTIQDSLNGADGYLDFVLFETYVNELLKDGYKEITYPFCGITLGSQIKYTRIHKESVKFCTGGWLIDDKPTHFVYRGHTTRSWSLQKKEIVRLFFKEKRMTTPAKTIKLKPINKCFKDKFSVFVGDIEIYRGRDSHQMNRFKTTKKYRDILKGSKYIFDD